MFSNKRTQPRLPAKPRSDCTSTATRDEGLGRYAEAVILVHQSPATSRRESVSAPIWHLPRITHSAPLKLASEQATADHSQGAFPRPPSQLSIRGDEPVAVEAGRDPGNPVIRIPSCDGLTGRPSFGGVAIEDKRSRSGLPKRGQRLLQNVPQFHACKAIGLAHQMEGAWHRIESTWTA
jgi:hypothetical protein